MFPYLDWLPLLDELCNWLSSGEVEVLEGIIAEVDRMT